MNTRTSSFTLAAIYLITSLIWITTAMAAQLLNGSFESGLYGWNYGGNLTVESAAPYAATDGQKLVAFNSANSTPGAWLNQTVVTEPGFLHRLTFDVGNLSYNGHEQKLDVQVSEGVNGVLQVLVHEVITVPGLFGGACNWRPRIEEFCSETANVTITFSDLSASTDAVDLVLDNVRLAPVTLNVTTGLDENDAALGMGAGDSLREVLAEAERRPGLDDIVGAGMMTLTRGPIVLDSEVRIRGGIISGNNSSRIFDVRSAVTLQGTSLTNGNAGGGDGGLITSSGSLILDRVNFSHGNANRGGGIAATAGTVKITDSTLGTNDATSDGGGLWCGNGALVTIVRSAVFENHAAGLGGGVACAEDGAISAVNTTWFLNSSNAGGAIFCEGFAGLRSCTISLNSSTGPGSGLSISYNMSSHLVMGACIVAGNTGGTDIDGSYTPRRQNLISGDPKLESPNYSSSVPYLKPLPGSPVLDVLGYDPDAPATDQRGWDRTSGSGTDLGAVELSQMTVNTLADESDGVEVNGVSLREAMWTGTPLSAENWWDIQHPEWIRFDPTLNGGTIDWETGLFLFSNKRDRYFDASNLANGITVRGIAGLIYFSECHNYGFENITFTGVGTLSVFEGQISFKNCDFINMPGQYGKGPLEGMRYGAIHLDGCNFINNHSDGNGGAIETKGQLTAINCTFSGNSATGDGGAIHTSWEEERSTYLSNCTFHGNSAGGRGGAIAGFFCTTRHCTISGNNAASGLGGGFYSLDPNSDDPNTFENSIISGNGGTDLAGEPGITWAHNHLGPVSARLAPLGSYGGPTMTMPPLPGSPVIDAGITLPSSPASDERGASRPNGGLPDIGAVEAFPFSTLSLIDSDHDGIDDRLEPSFGLTVGNDDSQRDSDGDGSRDAVELANMTDPLSADSVLKIKAFSPAAGFDPLTHPVFDMTISSFPGLDYTLEISPDLEFNPSTSISIPLGKALYENIATQVTLEPGRGFVRARRNP